MKSYVYTSVQQQALIEFLEANHGVILYLDSMWDIPPDEVDTILENWDRTTPEKRLEFMFDLFAVMKLRFKKPR